MKEQNFVPREFHRRVQPLRSVPVGQCVADGKEHPPVGAFEILLQGAFE
jgi:hypothetical protein